MCTSHVPHFLGNLFLTEKIVAYSRRSLTVRETSNKATHAPFNRLFRDDFSDLSSSLDCAGGIQPYSWCRFMFVLVVAHV